MVLIAHITEVEELQITGLLTGAAVIEVLRPGTVKELAAKPAAAFRALIQKAGQAGRVVAREAKFGIATTKGFLELGIPKIPKAKGIIIPFPKRLKLARIAAIGTRAKIAALPALPVEIALIIIGQTEPGEMLFKEIKRQVMKITSDDPIESLEGVLALSLLILGTVQVSVIAAGFAVGFTPAAAPTALAIGAGILLEVAIA